MSSAKLKIKEKINKKAEMRLKAGPELSVSGRKSKDRSVHVIGQENFRSVGEYYAFHDNMLRVASKKSKRRPSKRQSNSRVADQDQIAKSEIEPVAEVEIVPAVEEVSIKVEEKEPTPPIEVKPDVAPPVTPAVPIQDVDPQLETKPADESLDQDDFIPIAPSIRAIDEHLSELIAIQTCLAALIRRRRSVKQSKAKQLAAIAKKKRSNKASRTKEKKATVPSEEVKATEIQETKPSNSVQAMDPSIIMSVNYEDNNDISEFNDDDFEFPNEDDFLAHNGSPNDPMPFSEPVDFTSPSVESVHIRQISDPSREILAQDQFSCAPSFSCIRNIDSVQEELSLDSILALVKPESADEAWRSFHGENEFEAMHSSLIDAHMEVDDWLNLTTNEILPDALVVD